MGQRTGSDALRLCQISELHVALPPDIRVNSFTVTYSLNSVLRDSDNGHRLSSISRTVHSTLLPTHRAGSSIICLSRKGNGERYDMIALCQILDYCSMSLCLASPLKVDNLSLEYHSPPESGSSPRSPGSQVLKIHQTMRTVIIPAAVPTGIQIFLEVFWKLNINRATKNPQALFKRVNTLQRV